MFPQTTGQKLGRSIWLTANGLLFVLVAGCVTYVQRPPPEVQVITPLPPPVVPEPPPPVIYVEPPPVEPTAAVQIRVEADFYEPLGAYGHWEVIAPYGRCWVPARVEADWRPYCNGHWLRTERGWYWVSDEPWAWATYHYGRWDWRPEFGWYWVPHVEWAPAWVSWHRCDGYVGWAPLQPSARFTSSGILEVNARVIPPRAYVIVEERRFLEPIRPAVTVVNNTTIINKTVNITNVKVVNKTVINEGPSTTVIERASGHPVQEVAARELRRKTEVQAVSVAARKKGGSPGGELPSAPKSAQTVAEKAPPSHQPAPVITKPADEKPAAPPNRKPAQARQPKPAVAEVRPSDPSVGRTVPNPQPTVPKNVDREKPKTAPVRAEAGARAATVEPAQRTPPQHVLNMRTEPVAKGVAELRPKHEQVAREHGRTNVVNKGQAKKPEPKSEEKKN